MEHRARVVLHKQFRPSPRPTLRYPRGWQSALSAIFAAPGDSAGIIVTFKSGRYQQQVKKTTKVYTNDPERPVQRLHIAAYVIKNDETTGAIRVMPPVLKWRASGAGLVPRADTVTITHDGPDTLRVAVIHATDGVVGRVEFPQGTLLSQATRVVLIPTAGSYSSERHGASVTLALCGRDTTIFTLPVEVDD